MTPTPPGSARPAMGEPTDDMLLNLLRGVASNPTYSDSLTWRAICWAVAEIDRLRASARGETTAEGEPRAVKWELWHGEHHTDWHWIEERTQRDGSTLYAIADGWKQVMGRDGEWEWEPQPSSRDDAFIARTRFATFDEALAVYRASQLRAVSTGKGT